MTPRTAPGLWPREHGAYVELLAPLLTALLFLPFSTASLAYASAACALFLAHEPCLVLLGLRGARTRGLLAGPAMGRLVGCAVSFGVSAVSSGFAVVWPVSPPLGVGTTGPPENMPVM